MQNLFFTQLWLGYKQEVHNFPNRHILPISLLILTCEVCFENDLEGLNLMIWQSRRSNSYFKNDKALKWHPSRVIDPLNALLIVYVS